MRVENIAFLLSRLATDTPPAQQYRELTKNSLEAVARRQGSGDQTRGQIVWDVDWDYLQREGVYKACLIDNGDGMSPDQMRQYLNSLAVEGANEAQGLEGNFGVGAKITALHRNSYGLAYQSWRDGEGHMLVLHRDDSEGVYGIQEFTLSDGPHPTPKIQDNLKPDIVDISGTKVTLLGSDRSENTYLKAKDIPIGGDSNWLRKYLNSRFFILPDNVDMKVRILGGSASKWPDEEPEFRGGDKGNYFATIKGQKHWYDHTATNSGVLNLEGVDVFWWLFEDYTKVSDRLASTSLVSGHVSIAFQDEVYMVRSGIQARALMNAAGVLLGHKHFAFVFAPKPGSGGRITADTARSRIRVNGHDIEETGLWVRWCAEFASMMPKEVRDFVDQLMAEAEAHSDKDARDRIRKRLRENQKLLQVSRYSKDPAGQLRAVLQVSGGQGGGFDRGDGTAGDSGDYVGGGRRDNAYSHQGRAGNAYLSDLVDEEGDKVRKVRVPPDDLKIEWVSKDHGTRDQGTMEDIAAEIQGDVLTGNMVLANEDFRGFQDIVKYFVEEFGVNNTNELAIIKKNVKEWLEQQLTEAIIVTRNLEDGRVWTSEKLRDALCPEALTVAMAPRSLVAEKVRRMLGNELRHLREKEAESDRQEAQEAAAIVG